MTIGTFILNDETKANSYGFRIPNRGISLTRFLANPVMLDSHINSNSTVLGKWKNTRASGTNLIAEPEFDLEDAAAKEVESKVRRGFIKGASMGIVFDKTNMQMATDGVWELVKCELLEVSIVAIPSNANAISLFSQSGELISENTLRLSLQPLGLHTPAFSGGMTLDVFQGLSLKEQLNIKDNQPAVYRSMFENENKGCTATFSLPSEVISLDDFERLSNSEKMRFKLKFPVDYSRLFQDSGFPGDGATFSLATEIKTIDDFERLSSKEKMRFKTQYNSYYNCLFR